MPVSPDLIAWLDAWIDPERRIAEPDSALFVNPGAYNSGKWWSEIAIRCAWATVCAEVGVMVSN